MLNIAAICLDLLDSALVHQSAIYVAGALDTGRRYYEALANAGNISLVRTANQADMARVVASLRASKSCPIIDPGHLRVDHWSGADYSAFFLEVMRRYAKEVWYVDGWQYSSGATKEFLYCLSLAIPCIDEHGHELSAETGLTLLCSAVKDLEQLGVAPEKLQSRVDSLRGRIDQSGARGP